MAPSSHTMALLIIDTPVCQVVHILTVFPLIEDALHLELANGLKYHCNLLNSSFFWGSLFLLTDFGLFVAFRVSGISVLARRVFCGVYGISWALSSWRGVTIIGSISVTSVASRSPLLCYSSWIGLWTVSVSRFGSSIWICGAWVIDHPRIGWFRASSRCFPAGWTVSEILLAKIASAHLFNSTLHSLILHFL